MPVLASSFVAFVSIEAVIVLCGLGLLWRWQFSETARKQLALGLPLPEWDIRTHAFLFSVLRVLAFGLFVQWGASQAIGHFYPQIDFLKGIGIVISGGLFHAGMLIGILANSFFLRPELRAPWFTPTPLPDRWPVSKVPLAGAITFLIVTAVVILLTLGWKQVLSWFGVADQEQEMVNLMRSSISPWAHAGIVLLAVVVAPISEELLFRAGLFRFLRTRTPRWLALLAPAALFAGMHGNVTAFPPLIALGIIFSLAYERTGRIAVPMLAHALFNLHTVVQVYLGLDA